jgi:hypothetical protein
VFSLLDEQQSLYESLADIEKQRQDLAKEGAKLEKERLDHAERIAETEKRIADIMKKAAEDEAEIRRRGIMEAQLSVAEQKAIEIQKVRDQALEQLRDARKDLDDLQHDTSVEDHAKDLADQANDLSKNEERIRSQLRLNSIRLSGAQRVAAIEASVFGISGDRYQIEQRRADLEVRMAQLQVEKWKQTKALIDSIIETGDGVLFNPPPGFPQIRVQIGEVIIDNRDQSTNDVQVNGGGGSDGGGRPNPPPRERPDHGKTAPDSPFPGDFGDRTRRRYPGGNH